MALEESGIRLTVEDLDAFRAGLESATESLNEVGAASEETASLGDMLGSAWDSLAGIASGALTVALGGLAEDGFRALASAMGDPIASALENEQTLARLESQLKATGGAAGLTMDDLTGLASEFQNLAGGTDDTILAIESVGLKFSNITADVMPDFIQASLDMSAVMGTDATSAAQMLAMALEDPTGSLGRLKRAGIIFTDAEKEQIKAMQEAGDVAGAQQMVLDKLAATTGGAAAAQAETLAGKWEILQGRLGEAGEVIGMAVLPVLTDLFDNVIAPAIPTIELLAATIGTWLSTFIGYIQSGDISDFYTLLYDLFGEETAGRIADFIEGFMIGFQSIMAWFTENGPAMLATATEVFNGITAVIGSVIDWVVANWPQIQQTISTVMEAVGAVVGTVLAAVQGFWAEHGDEVMALVDTAMTTIQSVITNVMTIINTVVPAVLAAVQGFWQANGDTIMTIVEAAWNIIYTTIDTVLNLIQEIVLLVTQAITGDWEGFSETLTTIWETLWTGIQTILNNAWTIISEIVTNLVNGIVEIFNNTDWYSLGDAIITGLSNAISDGASWIMEQLADLARQALEAAKQALGIGSPSKVFADQVGAPIAQGIALGIKRNIGMVEGMVTDMTGAMQTSAQVALYADRVSAPPVSGAQSMRYVGPPQSAGNNVTVNANYARYQEPPAIVDDFKLAMALL